MAKDAHDREDLLRDATALDTRIELKIDNIDHTIVCGFRSCGAFSLYWSQDAVLQFNNELELRRAFWRGRMAASYQGTLHWLVRRSSSAQIRLIREPLRADENDDLLDFATECVGELRSRLATGSVEVIGQSPDGVDLSGQLATWLRDLPQPVRVAKHPGVGRKRG